MNRILISITGILLIFAGCEDRHYVEAPDDTIHGSGHLISETRPLPQFTSMQINTVAEVELSRGDDQEVIVIVDDNIMEFIMTQVSGGDLQVGVSPGVSLSDFSLTLQITTPEITAIAVNSVASVTSNDSFDGDILMLAMNSVGNISLDIDMTEVFSADNSVGTIDLRGTAVTHYAAISSVGSIFAYDLDTDTTIVATNSVGSAYVRASYFLRATINSTGSIYYKGHPEIQLVDNGTGRLIDAN